MDFETVKQLARKFGSVVILDGDRPGFVVFDYETYMRKDEGVYAGSSSENDSSEQNTAHHQQHEPRLIGGQSESQHIIESLNREIQALNDEIREKEREGSVEV